MKQLQGMVAVTGRVLLCVIFLMAAVGNKIPHFGDVAKLMDYKGKPIPLNQSLPREDISNPDAGRPFEAEIK